jgi:PhnB protein
MARKGKVKPIPEGYHSITPNLVIRGARKALEFYKKVFSAAVTFLQARPDGKVMHATIKIGDSILMIADECSPHEGHKTGCVRSPADLGGTTTNLYLYVNDADAVFDKAVKNGAVVLMPIADMFWGDRVGMFTDPFGHSWSVATHKEEVSAKQLKKNMEKFFSQQPSASC